LKRVVERVRDLLHIALRISALVRVNGKRNIVRTLIGLLVRCRRRPQQTEGHDVALRRIPVLAVVQDRDPIAVFAVIRKLVPGHLELVALPCSVPGGGPAVDPKGRVVRRKVRVEGEGELELEQLVSLVPVDMTVEPEESQRRGGRRSAVRIQRDIDGAVTLPDLELALDRYPLRSAGGDIARGKSEVLKVVEVVLLDGPCTDELD